MDARTFLAPASSAVMISRTVPALVGTLLRVTVLMTLMLITNLLTVVFQLMSGSPAGLLSVQLIHGYRLVPHIFIQCGMIHRDFTAIGTQLLGKSLALAAR